MSIGEALPRPDGRIKVTGQAKYTADQRLDGALFLVLVGSPVPAGTLRQIDAGGGIGAGRRSGVDR